MTVTLGVLAAVSVVAMVLTLIRLMTLSMQVIDRRQTLSPMSRRCLEFLSHVGLLGLIGCGLVAYFAGAADPEQVDFYWGCITLAAYFGFVGFVGYHILSVEEENRRETDEP